MYITVGSGFISQLWLIFEHVALSSNFAYLAIVNIIFNSKYTVKKIYFVSYYLSISMQIKIIRANCFLIFMNISTNKIRCTKWDAKQNLGQKLNLAFKWIYWDWNFSLLTISKLWMINKKNKQKKYFGKTYMQCSIRKWPNKVRGNQIQKSPKDIMIYLITPNCIS